MKFIKLTVSFSILCAATALASPTDAYELRPGGNNSGVVSGLGAGLKDLGVESIFVVGYDKVGDADGQLRATVVGSAAFNYFLLKNFSLGLSAGVLYKHASQGDLSGSDLGGIATVNAAYNVPLGGGLFLRPMLGAGGFYTKRDATVPALDPDDLIRSTVAGGVGRAGLGLAFYASPRFMLRAGPEAVVQFGTNSPAKPEHGDAQSFAGVDAAFSVSMSYVF